ncbi:MAG TPA: hypothetical protein VFE32_17370 [Puia sp.]|jgi:hypothetical protein|nr:hypothetical protein [Puia sp.]
MEAVTKENFRTLMERCGFTVSKCTACGNLYKCFLRGVNNQVLEIRPAQTVHGTFVIKKNGSAVASGYLYDLNKNLEKYFPQAGASAAPGP